MAAAVRVLPSTRYPRQHYGRKLLAILHCFAVMRDPLRRDVVGFWKPHLDAAVQVRDGVLIVIFPPRQAEAFHEVHNALCRVG
jgi:hypothetical protein